MPPNCCIIITKRYIFTLLAIIITLTQIIKTHTTCTQSHCNLSQCPNPSECMHGFTDDECQCCQVCLKTKGETCGPNDKCAKGLKCLSPQRLDSIDTNLVNSDQEIGVCGALNCTGVICENTSAFKEIKCPNDSYKLLSATNNSCCHTKCVCLPDICSDLQTICPNNKRPHIVRPGDGKPGSCCDQIHCIEAPTKCIHNNKQFLNGDKWMSDKCTTCECRDGLSFCYKKQCKQLVQKDCNVMTGIEDECCPICQGCISSNGKFYNNTHNWYENDCSHCECNNGQISCKVQMCSPVHCDKPINIEGQCCPICPTKSANTCNIDCPQGYKRNHFGHEICECDQCLNKLFKCKIFCPKGFQRGSDGCPICQCLTLQYNLNRNNSITKTEDSVCNLTNGSLVTNGLFWSDGCRECFCNSGKIMCTEPNCPPIHCSTPVFITTQCCPICIQHFNQDVNQNSGAMTSSHIHSHLFITAIILTLIIAILLLGIFILLAIFITKKYPQKYIRNRVINGSLRESGIIHLWPNTTDPTQASQTPDKQLLSVGVGNANNNLLNYDSLRINDTLQDKLLANSPPND